MNSKNNGSYSPSQREKQAVAMLQFVPQASPSSASPNN